MDKAEALELIEDYYEVRDDFNSLSDETIFRIASDILVRFDEKFDFEMDIAL